MLDLAIARLRVTISTERMPASCCLPEGCSGSHFTVALTLGGGPPSDLKPKKQDQELTLGLEGRLAPGSSRVPPGGPAKSISETARRMGRVQVDSPCVPSDPELLFELHGAGKR